MMALEWTDINTRQGILTVARSEWKGQVREPKGGQPRKVRMTARLAGALQALRRVGPPRVLYADKGGSGGAQSPKLSEVQ